MSYVQNPEKIKRAKISICNSWRKVKKLNTTTKTYAVHCVFSVTFAPEKNHFIFTFMCNRNRITRKRASIFLEISLFLLFIYFNPEFRLYYFVCTYINKPTNEGCVQIKHHTDLEIFFDGIGSAWVTFSSFWNVSMLSVPILYITRYLFNVDLWRHVKHNLSVAITTTYTPIPQWINEFSNSMEI